MVLPKDDTQEVEDPEPVPSPTFIPYPKWSLFDNFEKSLQGRLQPAFNTIFVVPFIQGLQWELPQVLKVNGADDKY